MLTPFWTKVQHISQKFTDFTLPGDQAFFLLHHSWISNKMYTFIICHLLNAAKSCIILKWKDTSPSVVSLWLGRVDDFCNVEDFILSSLNKHETFKKTWLDSLGWDSSLFFPSPDPCNSLCLPPMLPLTWMALFSLSIVCHNLFLSPSHIGQFLPPVSITYWLFYSITVHVISDWFYHPCKTWLFCISFLGILFEEEICYLFGVLCKPHSLKK